MGTRKRVMVGTGITLGATIAAPGVAQADTFEVTNLLDDGSGGTLREAVDDANSNDGFDRILFESGLSGTLTLTDGDLEIYDGVEIVGPGHARVTIDGDENDRIFSIYPGQGPPAGLTKVTISGLTLTGGDPGDEGDGGAIYSIASDLVIEDSVITGNFALDNGGAVFSKYGSLIVDSSVISNNNAVDEGGGIATKYSSKVVINNTTVSGNESYESGGGGMVTGEADTVVVTDSTFSGNTTDVEEESGGAGGAIAAYGSTTLVANSTLSGNSAYDGGAIAAANFEYQDVGSKFTVRNSTIAGNDAVADGGGLVSYGDTPVFSTNTIVANNTAGDEGPNVSGELDAAFTLVNDPAGAAINETTPGSNVIGVDPQLGPLANNGGPTQTHALLSGSPALDAGNGTGSNHDQRAQARPVELPDVPNSTAPGADGSDIGAYEAQAPPPPPQPTEAFCRGVKATIIATPGVPTNGTEGGDVIVGTLGPDQINGLGGGDLICGWDGNDQISGGAANDTVVGQRGEDSLSGDAGKDRVGGGSGEDSVRGGGGGDGLIGGPNDDVLRGGAAKDRIFGKAGDDTMFGDGGPDRLRGGPGTDRFNGGPGANTLFLIRGDGDSLFGNNEDSKVVLAGRQKRKLPPS
jgi:Ca2+-binding RTX toxin-like protein